MQVNYKEGMFLGKEEMQRAALIDESLAESISFLIKNSANNNEYGLLNCSKLQVTDHRIDGSTFCLVLNGVSKVRKAIGRGVIGNDNTGARMGLPCEGSGWSYAFPEVQGNVSSLSDGDYGLVLSAAVTHYENALISISSTGLGTFSVNGAKVIGLFRQGTKGRQAKIQLENNTVLTVSSVDTTNNTVQFAGDTFTAVTNSKFMFVQTLSPFVSDTPQPLYDYPSCSLEITQTEYTDGLHFVCGYVSVYSGEIDELVIEDDGPSGYTWRDTVGSLQIQTPMLAALSVTGGKIANSAINSGHLASGAVVRNAMNAKTFGYRQVLADQGTQGEILYVEPGSIITNYYNYDNPYVGRYIKPRIPSGWTLNDCILQPAKVITGINHAASPTYELISYFQSDSGISFSFDADMQGVVPDDDHICIFDFYWMSLTQIFVKFTYVGANL